MLRRIVLPVIFFLAAAILIVSVANAIVRRYALPVLESIAADGHAIGQEIQSAMGEISQIFQEHGIETPDESRLAGKGHRYRAGLTGERHTALRERVAEIRNGGKRHEAIY